MDTNQNSGKNKWQTIIIGAGQAGLATGYYLKKLNKDFIIIDAEEKIGDQWRHRWDSLKLFTPAQYDGLPGLEFPASHNSFPSKDDIADYLSEYAKRFHLPVYLKVKANRLSSLQKGFEIDSSMGKLFSDSVIIATGTNPIPKIPDFAKNIDTNIFQIHSSQYINPKQIPQGDTLVVGAGTSGVEIALELASSRNTIISGKPTFHIPDPLFKYAGGFYWWLISNILTVKTPIGKKAKNKVIHGGAPLIRISANDLDKAGVERTARVNGVANGLPQLADGKILNVKNIIWCTGFKPDFSWISLDVTNGTGWPVTYRGISLNIPGLYFVGMPFQYGLTSGLVGGVGRDAAFISKHIN